ncbi:hypothetical protein AAC387_Pa12g0698 [Persea americana]
MTAGRRGNGLWEKGSTWPLGIGPVGWAGAAWKKTGRWKKETGWPSGMCRRVAGGSCGNGRSGEKVRWPVEVFAQEVTGGRILQEDWEWLLPQQGRRDQEKEEEETARAAVAGELGAGNIEKEGEEEAATEAAVAGGWGGSPVV